MYGASRGYAYTVTRLRRHINKNYRVTHWTKNFLRNTPIQGSATAVFKKAVVSIDQEFLGTDTFIILTVYDSVVLECSFDIRNEVATRAQQLMKSAVRSFYPALNGSVDINIEHPQCWNKKGNPDSLEKFFADPSFNFNLVNEDGSHAH